jgi:hypothetical protein
VETSVAPAGEAGVELPGQAGEATDEQADKPKDRSRRRRRRKGSKRDDDIADNEKETTIAETLSAEAGEEDDSTDEGEDVSGWDVPSWNDLIAELYRPDR